VVAKTYWHKSFPAARTALQADLELRRPPRRTELGSDLMCLASMLGVEVDDCKLPMHPDHFSNEGLKELSAQLSSNDASSSSSL
jgi:hypothetical protein